MAGLLLGLLFIPGKVPLWALMILPFLFIPLYWSSPGRSARDSFVLGWLFGTIESLTSLWWILPTIRTFGHLPSIAAFSALFLLSSYLGFFTGFFQLGLDLWKKSRLAHYPILLSLWGGCLWVILEDLRSELFTGFPLNPLGDLLWGQTSLVGLASITGVTGLSFCIVFLAGLLTEIIQSWQTNSTRRERGISAFSRWAPPIVFFLAILGWVWAGKQASQEMDQTNLQHIRLGIIQGNIPQDQKWTIGFLRKSLSIYHDLSDVAVKKGATLLIWPETAIPVVLSSPPRSLTNDLKEAITLPVPLVTGTLGLTRKPDSGYAFSNDAVIISPLTGLTGVYSKMHLVPFGEYIPFPSLFGWLRGLTGVTGDLSTGREQTVFTTSLPNTPPSSIGDQLRIGPVICYEAMYPSLVRHLVQTGATILVVLTDDAWYGKTAASHQLYQQTMLRAIENGVPEVRAANTGYSGAISATGKPLVTGKRFIAESLVVNLPLDSRHTFYRAHGEWVFRLAVLLFFSLLAILSMEQHNEKIKF